MNSNVVETVKSSAITAALNRRRSLIPKLRAVHGHGPKMSIAEAARMFLELARSAEIYGRIVGAKTFLEAVDRFLEDVGADVVAALTLAADPVLDGAGPDDPALIPFDPPTLDEISRHFSSTSNV